MGTSMTVDVFHRVGTEAVMYDSQKRECRIRDSSVAHSLSTCVWIPSGLGAFLGLHRLSCGCTFSTVNAAACVGSGIEEDSNSVLHSSEQLIVSNRMKNVFRFSAKEVGSFIAPALGFGS